MLKYLHIENVAVIERADISFEGHFSVLTGETGAGKSIIIDAINTVLGHRTSKEIIRTGCEQVVVSALFDRLPQSTCALLKENGYEPDEDGNLLINRTLQKNGNGLIRINGRPATATFLREVGQGLIDVHGQHDSQSLLNPKKHIEYIDKLAENESLRQEYLAEFKHLNEVRRKLLALEQEDDEKNRRMELLTYQIKELQSAKISVGELEEIKKKLSVAENYQKIHRLLTDAYFYLQGDLEADGGAELLKKAAAGLVSTGQAEFEKLSERLGEALALVEEVSGEVRAFSENGEYSEQELSDLRDRLDLLHKLMVKYGDTEEKMLDYCEKAEQELDTLVHSEEEMNRLGAELDASTERLVALAERLTESRKKAADRFSAQVTEALCDLDMPRVAFEVSRSQGRYTKNGCDEIEFLLSANEGESVRPLHKIASGGELSRVMLAVKSILAEKDEVPTLIFDEIDTGISGHAAHKVGKRIREVSGSHQVLCVTHLAQIAAFADEHLLIEKSTVQNRVTTQVHRLDEDARVREIARIMSGDKLTEHLLNSAKELLDRSRNQ